MSGRWVKWAAGTAGIVLLAVFIADRLLPPPLERAASASTVVYDRNEQPLYVFATPEGRWRLPAHIESIDPKFVERLIAIEDKRFYRHIGVDVIAIVRAGFSSLRAGKIVSGASTITMQTARLLEPRPRNFSSKAIEIIRALQIERRLSKDEILALYLTLAPYGGNIEGVRAASLLYFDKEPERLTDAQHALLIALPQAPEARRPDLREAGAKIGRRIILEKLVAADALSPARAQEADDATIPITRNTLPKRAYHASVALAGQRNDPKIVSTLDADLQRQAESIITRHVRDAEDGATAAALIIESETRSVRAAIGSSGFDVDGGWIDLTRAVRSPGSTLKPFIYGLAFDDGIARPSTVIDDMPRRFGDYSPENFDRTFRGEVRAEEALKHSLNLPAVDLLNRFGVSRFASLLRAAGIGLKTPNTEEKTPGLAIALGGAGVKATDLALLYAALDEGGRVEPMRWTSAPAEASDGYQLISTQAADKISAILASAPSLAGRAPTSLAKSATDIAFKTGTSYGFRDAWAAGHGGGYTIVAWVGRADGASRPGQSGRKAAAPLLFELFDLLDREGALSDESIAALSEGEAGEGFRALNNVTRATAPEIVFPSNGVELILSSAMRGVSLAARGGAGERAWYVNGERLPVDEKSARTVWRPETPGFYDIVVTDGQGRSARSKVRVSAS